MTRGCDVFIYGGGRESRGRDLQRVENTEPMATGVEGVQVRPKIGRDSCVVGVVTVKMLNPGKWWFLS